MAEKNIKSRIVHKHDLESNWLLATNFTPKQGELIVYDIDENYNYERLKIGDGAQNVNALPFVSDALKTELLGQIGVVDGKVDAVSALVGDTAVSEQISEAIADKVNKEEVLQIITATTEDGVAYTANVPGITEFVTGKRFVLVTETTSKSTTLTLNINGLGVKNVRRRLSTGASVAPGYVAGWITKNKPYMFMYDGIQWVVEGQEKPVGLDLYGPVQATQDADGNTIVDTYATKTELQNYIPKLTSITLTAANWTASNSIYYQDIALSCVTATSMVSLQPTPVQLASWQDDGFAFTTYSANGSVSVYVTGGKPTEDYTVQVIVQEVMEV